MPQGQLHMRFTGDANKLAAEVRRLRAEMTKLKTQMRQSADQASSMGNKQQSVLMGWAKGLLGVTAGYLSMQTAIQGVNMHLERRNRLEEDGLNAANRIGAAWQRLLTMTGDMPEAEFAALEQRWKTLATTPATAMPPEELLDMFRVAVSASEPRRRELGFQAIEASAAFVKGYGREDREQIVGLLTDLAGYQTELGEEILDVRQATPLLMRALSIARVTEPGAMGYMSRAMMQNLQIAQPTTREQAERVMVETIAQFARGTQWFKDPRGEFTAGWMQQSMATLYRTRPELVEGRTPFEAWQAIMQDERAKAVLMDQSKWLGRSGAQKMVAQRVFEGDKKLWSELESTRSEIANMTQEETDRTLKRISEGNAYIRMRNMKLATEARRDIGQVDTGIAGRGALVAAVEGVEDVSDSMAASMLASVPGRWLSPFNWMRTRENAIAQITATGIASRMPWWQTLGLGRGHMGFLADVLSPAIGGPGRGDLTEGYLLAKGVDPAVAKTAGETARDLMVDETPPQESMPGMVGRAARQAAFSGAYFLGEAANPFRGGGTGYMRAMIQAYGAMNQPNSQKEN